jgi:hypothetical protein
LGETKNHDQVAFVHYKRLTSLPCKTVKQKSD